LIVIFYPQFHGIHGIARYLESLLTHGPSRAPSAQAGTRWDHTAPPSTRSVPDVEGTPKPHPDDAAPPPEVVLITARGSGPPRDFPGVEVIEIAAPDHRLGLLQWGWRARQVLQDLERRGPIEAVNLHIPPLIPALFLSRRWPLVLTAHTTYLGMSGRLEGNRHFASPWGWLSVQLKMGLERFILARSDRVITLTAQGRQELARYGRRDDVVVWPNGVDVERFHPAPPGAAIDFDVLFCGRIEKRKGSRPLVEVCRRLVTAEPGVRIGIVGVGDDEPHVRQALEALSPQVTLLGRVPLSDMPTLYRRGRVYAATSYYEGLPGTCLEAMACGLPAVVWDRAFYDDLVIDGKTGRRIAVNDIAAMVDALQALLHDAPACRRLGHEARAQVSAHFDWRRLGPKVLAACRSARPRSAAPLRVTWAGLRGIPGVQGGVEAHAEQLCPRLQALGCEVTVIGRQGYAPDVPGGRWRGVRLESLWAPRHKHLEALVHTGLAVLHAGLISRPDVLHLQAIGPALWTPLARLLGLRVVVTHHGPDYARQKWGGLARAALRAGEAAAARWADALIVISRVIQDDVAARHRRQGVLIPNGVAPAGPSPSPALLETFGLRPGRYVLLVSRLVPEKRHHDLITAFDRAGLPSDWRLVLTGAADHADAYAASVQAAAAQTQGVVMTGFQTGEALQALYAHAGLFVLPSSHEGLPIALLEALSWGRSVVASDIPAHRELGLAPQQLFALGDIDALARQLRAAAGLRPGADAAPATHPDSLLSGAGPRLPDPAGWIAERFDWDRSARQTLALYERVARRPATTPLSTRKAWNAPS